MKQYKVKWHEIIGQFDKTEISGKTFDTREEAERYAKYFPAGEVVEIELPNKKGEIYNA